MPISVFFVTSYRARIITFLVGCILLIPKQTLAWPFADRVISYEPGPGQWISNPQFNNPARALGRPYGISVTVPDNSSLVSLGDGGRLTLAFNRPVWNDPRNPYGYDFIVFGNPTWIGGNPSYRWLEPAFVEIAVDANNNGVPDDEWFLILPNKLPGELIGSPAPNSDTGYSSTILYHYAEYTPTLSLPSGISPEDFYTSPDRWSMPNDPESLLIDSGSGGGDAFDIAYAVRQIAPGVPLYPLQYANLPYFNFIRITDAVVGDTAGVLGEISAEIDAVSDVSPLLEGPSIGSAKKLPNGTVVSIASKVVTAVFDGEIYVQEEDRSSGIKVLTTDLASVGDSVDVIGILHIHGGEHVLEKASVYIKTSGKCPKPLGIPVSRISSPGLDAAGLLCTTWGWVTAAKENSFCLGETPNSLDLEVPLGSVSMPPLGSFVIITGIISQNSEGCPVLKVRSSLDISVKALGSRAPNIMDAKSQ